MKMKQPTQELNKELMLALAEDYNDPEYLYKEYNYLKIDGKWVEIGKTKPRINSCMYYNDERKSPSVNFDNFSTWNRNNKKQKIDINEIDRLCFKVLFFDGENIYRVWRISLASDEENLTRLTIDQAKQINAEIDKLNADYDKRLQNYWKRYSDKVTTSGYWADR